MKKFFVVAAFIFVWATTTSAQPKPGLNVGDKAPELIGKSFTGDTLRLSDTKGKYVLIDFWASWCRPCRIENPVVVNAYRKFKDKNFGKAKGFTVFSVSLDRTEEAWKKGVEADNLEWPYHISDLKGWYSKHGAIYGVRQIPVNFLIDGEGTIVAKNLRGPALAATLESLSK